MLTRIISLLFFYTFSLQVAGQNTPGIIDRSYASNGFIQFNAAGSTAITDKLHDIKNAGTGKLNFLSHDDGHGTLYVGRLDANGNLDPTFGQGGIRGIPAVSPSHLSVIVKDRALVNNPNDTSLIVINNTGTSSLQLHKFNDHGDYDPAFGNNGISLVSLSKPVYTVAKALYLPDGKILVLIGTINSPDNASADIMLVRLLANGSLDNTFGTNGIVTIDQTVNYCTGTCFGNRDFANDMIYTSDNKIIVTGTITGPSTSSTIFRLNDNGTKDLTFGTSGIIRILISGWEILTLSVREQESQKFIVACNQENTTSGFVRNNIVRYNNNGTQDNTFTSVYLPAIPGSIHQGIVGSLVQKDKKIDVLMVSSADANGRPYIVRLKKHGIIDSSFGVNGIGIVDTLSILPASSTISNTFTYFDQDLQGRLNLGTTGLYSSLRNLLFTRINIGDMPGLSAPTANAGPDRSLCPGIPTIIGTPVTPATSDFDYAWTSSPAGFISSLPNPSTTPFGLTVNYYLTVTNALGVIAYDTMVITLLPAPVGPFVTASGTSQFCTGGSVTLNSTATSGNQWYKDGSLISGATAQNYLATQTGSYLVQLTNGTCSVSSNAMPVLVSPVPPAPTLSANGPINFCSGGSVVLTSSAAVGNQWFRNGVLIPGAGNSTYTVTTAGDYTNTASVAGCNSNPSNVITVIVNSGLPVPAITASGAISFCQGSSVTLTSSSVTGNQWYKGGVIISGATGQTYIANQTGNYTVQNSNGSCSVNSAVVSVTVTSIPATPVITAGGSVSFCQGGNVLLTSSASTGNQWFRDNTVITGAIAATYNATQTGSYTVRSTINSCSSVLSSAIIITATPLPSTPAITASGPISFCQAGNVVFSSSAATGNQWYKDGAVIAGANSQTYTATQSGLFTVRSTTNGCTSAAPAGIAVSVNTLPPTPTIVRSGNILNSSATSGNQWYKDGAAIAGATAINYAPVSSGLYSVRVTNNGCSSEMSVSVNFVVTAINSPNLNEQIIVAPNPVNDHLSVSSSISNTRFQLLISDAAGRQVFQSVFSGNIRVNVRKYEAGIYVVRLINLRNGEHLQKVILKL